MVMNCLVLCGVVKVELGSADGSHDRVEDAKLTGRQGANHDATGDETRGAQLGEANLARNVDQARRDAASTTSAGLVDLTNEMKKKRTTRWSG